MRSLILVGPTFDATWPFAADHAHRRWQGADPARSAADPDSDADVCTILRLGAGDTRLAGAIIAQAGLGGTQRLLLCEVMMSSACLRQVPKLQQLGALAGATDHDQALAAAGMPVVRPLSEGFWGQSVAEFALGLTICALRRMPQCHQRIQHDLLAWDYQSALGQPGARGQQFGDDPAFVNGTICGKRIGVIGMGNIGARYAAWCVSLGAQVTAYDPVAPEAVFHRSGVRRCHQLERLFTECDICAPMMPLRPSTAGMVTREHLRLLPRGALVVLVTRSGIVDMDELRRRVLAHELALAADVFDQEPLPLTDPLLGLGHVVHTPHQAGRTVHANQSLADAVLEQMAETTG